eukprot:CAMPEP_0195305182 /NCGR_PEP_ID=MMETSP0707-20130614/35829_1 /TAXON_ID=33640 /ORGANISM="Asterionellopsis glacialis, Strain CCMP134" /LENGTH=89 /DNA_ID=CAMNT_0040369221 /DNA_START=34 /DNA_END=300 /DNA_ORIENTATION=+
MVAGISGLVMMQTPKDQDEMKGSTYLANSKLEPSKYAYELYALLYTPMWIGAFGIIVVFQLYEDFTATTYNVVCVGLALPLLLQPLLFP